MLGLRGGADDDWTCTDPACAKDDNAIGMGFCGICGSNRPKWKCGDKACENMNDLPEPACQVCGAEKPVPPPPGQPGPLMTEEQCEYAVVNENTCRGKEDDGGELGRIVEDPAAESGYGFEPRPFRGEQTVVPIGKEDLDEGRFSLVAAAPGPHLVGSNKHRVGCDDGNQGCGWTLVILGALFMVFHIAMVVSIWASPARTDGGIERNDQWKFIFHVVGCLVWTIIMICGFLAMTYVFDCSCCDPAANEEAKEEPAAA